MILASVTPSDSCLGGVVRHPHIIQLNNQNKASIKADGSGTAAKPR